MQYASITVWQAEYYELRVKYGAFPSKKEAEIFGNSCRYLWYSPDNESQMFLANELGKYVTLDDSQVELWKLKASSEDKCFIDDSDLELCPLTIKKMSRVKDLASFGSSSFGAVAIDE